MEIPPADDPLRPVCLAARSLRLLGVLFVLIGLVTPVSALKQGYTITALPPAVVVTSLTHLVPGILYHLCAALLLRGRRAGVFAAMGLAMAHFILVAGNLAAYTQMLILGGTSVEFLFVALTVGFLTVAALAQLMYHLVKSLRVLRPPTEATGEWDLTAAPVPE
jgi:hypothetical protein